MTIASQLPNTILDSRGGRLRYELANALNECEAEYRRGAYTKAPSLEALLQAALTKVQALKVAGNITIGNVSGDNTITAAEAASAIPVSGTTTNVPNGTAVLLFIDDQSVGSGTVSSNTYTIQLSSAAATALSIGAHVFKVQAIDGGGLRRTNQRTVQRTA